MTRFSAQIAVMLAVAGVSLAGCELIVGGHHVAGTGGAGGGGGGTASSSSSTSTSTGSSSGAGGKGGAGGATASSSSGTGGMGTGGMGTGGLGTGGMGTGGATSSSSSSGMTGCVDATTCPGVDDECQKRTCTAGVCGFSYTAAGTPTTAGQTPSDCKVAACDGSGSVASFPDNADILDDGNPCTADSCAGGMPLNTPSAAGSACSVGAGTQCDGNGACVECLQNSDCTVTGFCSALHTCLAATCGDLALNGTESDIDCGGSCSPCGTDKACLFNADCASKVCTLNKCQAPSCTDLVKNGTEGDVDCGGTCPTKCAAGKTCAVDADCLGGSCSGSVCLPTCTDGVKNAGESDVDCGGSTCPKCVTNKDCTAGTDCASGVCTGNKCQAATCGDNVKNGTETDIDCGGSCPSKCGNGLKCGGAVDCGSGVCSGTPLTCQVPTCNDTVKNGGESDVDCGAVCTSKCVTGKVCGTGADCVTGVCTAGFCAAASCGDGVKSPGEGCDDGNKTAGDGCSALCFAEFGFVCAGQGPGSCHATCGDGAKASVEACDDHNTTSGDGCSATCTVENGFTCTGVAPSVCAPTCGDGLKVGSEGCDDGNAVSGDGCSATCTVEAGFTCVGAGAGSCHAICGDGILKGSETCDDGNTVGGDGCTATCQVQAGYSCTGAPSVCTPVCGDGVKTGAESCDDGNAVSGDGCSATCAVEAGYACTGVGAGSCAPICGDGQKHGAEACDDGNAVSGDGCSATCTVEAGYACTGVGAGSCAPVCGDGQKHGAETCDDGNAVSGDGCSATCTVETGFTCSGVGAGSCTSTCGDGVKASNEACDDGNTANSDGCSSGCTVESGWSCAGQGAGSCHTTCGDGIKAGAEACDDHNTSNNDGCSSTCTVETGFTCAGSAPTVCSAICGDNIKTPTEACDDGNLTVGDGCSAVCSVEPGYTCVGSPSVCTAGCGDGIKAGSETCDDGNNVSNDGCSSSCQAETGYVCAGQGAGSCVTVCGDGITAGGEQCDDGNANAGDGCNACAVETGWMCAGAVCAPICGDGLVVGAETCDDSNAASGDGCSSVCTTETGWTCVGAPSACTTTCGDGIKAGSEGCDDANTANNDGCTAGCTVEIGWTCTGAGAGRCSTTCGDGVKVGTEACDDANLANGDGCSSACAVEQYWACTGSAPSTCNGICGDSQIKGTEQCDDGNVANNDGCTSTCQYEAGFEIEANNTIATANSFAARQVGGKVNGYIKVAGDVDYFSFVIPAGSTGVITATTITNFLGTVCGSTTATDTKLTLYTAGGTSLVSNDDFGSTYCSSITSGTLAAGTYYVAVQHSSSSSTLVYTMQASLALATCGNGVVETGEGCDDTNTTNGDGCSSACAVESGYTCTGTAPSACTFTCGNGTKTGSEQCDDGNLANGDGCSATCQLEYSPEVEANSTCATANGPFTIPQSSFGRLLSASITPATDQDWFSFTTSVYADLSFETFSSLGPGNCTSAEDTVIQLYKADCTTSVGVSQDQGSSVSGGYCSLLNPTTQPTAMKHLAPGTYNLKVTSYLGGLSFPYTVQAKYVAYCGNGIIEGSEQCDGGPLCQADCTNVPVCGNGIKDTGEGCDDGNTTSGDGCSATCQWEFVPEVEANGTCATANTFTIPTNSVGRLVSGSLNPPGTTSGDQDWFAFTVSNYADVTFQTFDSTGPGSCSPTTVDTQIALYSTCGGAVLVSNDTGASPSTGNCSLISATTSTFAKHMAPGTYYLLVNGFGSTAYNYSLQVRYTALCGNGVIEGSEQCDGGPLCGTDCNLLPICGDGIKQVGEGCDDGNTTSGDGCSSTCQWEFVPEVEANGTCATANTFTIPTHSVGRLVSGSLNPPGTTSGDQDWFAFTVPAYADLSFQTFDSTGPGSCSPSTVDTQIALYTSCGGAVVTSNDTGGISNCSLLTAATNAALKHVPPGTYYLLVNGFGSTAYNYSLQAKYLSLCGNGVVEGSEQCDGGANCNTSCQWTTVGEVEPNDTTAAADTNAGNNPLLLIDGNRNITGALTGTTDKDIFKMVVAANNTVVRLETFDTTGVECRTATPYSMVSHNLRILNSAGTMMVTDYATTGTPPTGAGTADGTQSGIGVCAALSYRLDAGTYYVQVDKTAALTGYQLRVVFQTDLGSEVEPNDVYTAGTSMPGRDTEKLGDHTAATDTDFYAVTVPAGGSIRAEVIEGDGVETCESLGIDSSIALFGPTGASIMTATGLDAGRGLCSMFDGTGVSPLNSLAHNLTAGTYYIRVTSAGTTAVNANQFNYRLVVNVGF
jgi:cysteine-rich repeat protein